MFMEIAFIVSKRSTCLRLQVGTVITDSEMLNILAIGYNGNYSGGPNVCDSDVPGSCGCVHSEINALIKPNSARERIMFITDSPCEVCAKAIINSGIKKVHYKNEYRITKGLKLLRKANVGIVKMS